jgi:hypothetical protein
VIAESIGSNRETDEVVEVQELEANFCDNAPNGDRIGLCPISKGHSTTSLFFQRPETESYSASTCRSRFISTEVIAIGTVHLSI